MRNYSKCLPGILAALLLAACGRSPEPPKPADSPEPQVANDVKSAGLPELVEDLPGVECAGQIEPQDAQVRLTLNSEGDVLQAESVNHSCNWEAALDQRTGSQPASVGEPVGTITIYALNKDPSDLVNSEGESMHSHAGGSHGSLTSHCHRWYNNGGNWILVHC